MMCNQREISDILGVDGKSIRNWEKQGLPVINGGTTRTKKQYDSVAVIEWMINKNMPSQSQFDYAEEQARHEHFKADKVELQVLRIKGDLVSTESVVNLISDIVISAKSKILGIPDKIKNNHNIDDRVYAKLKIEINEVLNELAINGVREKLIEDSSSS